LDETVNILEGVVDKESNLKPVVLRKRLYRLGFAFEEIDILKTQLINY